MNGRIYCLVGKSCSGKDTLYAHILRCCPELKPVVTYTTRPRRTGERDGQQYWFVGQEELKRYEADGQVIEKREYHTNQGLWTYFTRRFDLEEDRLIITTLEGVHALIEHYGPDCVHVIYLDIDDRIRLMRCIQREESLARPDYTEMCRRYCADQADFSPDKLAQIPALHRIDTKVSVEECVKRFKEFLV